MKYYNRNNVLLRVGDNILLNGRYYQITDSAFSQFVKEFGGTNGLDSGVTGTKTRVTELEPKDYNGIAYVVMGVYGTQVSTYAPNQAGTNAVRGGNETAASAVNNSVRTDSCDFALFSPQQQPLFLTPDGNTQGVINYNNSPVDDPDETMGIWVMHDDELYVQATNNTGAGGAGEGVAATIQFFCYFYTLAPLQQKPAIFTPIAYHASRLSPTLKDFVA
jgi:hypothetical protein